MMVTTGRLDYEELDEREKRVWDAAFGEAMVMLYKSAVERAYSNRLALDSDRAHQMALESVDAHSPDKILDTADAAVWMLRRHRSRPI